MKTRAIVFAVGLGMVAMAPALAEAGPAAQTQRAFRPHVSKAELTCPEGTTLSVEQTSDGVVETCLNAKGARNGYFVQWSRDGKTWAVLGRFENGRKAGRWVSFLEDGRPARVTYFRDGVVFLPWEEAPSMVASAE